MGHAAPTERGQARYDGVTRRLRMVPVDAEGQRQRIEVKHQPPAYVWLLSVLRNSPRYVFI